MGLLRIIIKTLRWIIQVILELWRGLWSESKKHLSKNERRTNVVLGLCVGDSLGATSEYENPR
jgi:hypothetical protein